MAARSITHPPFRDKSGVYPDRTEAGQFLGEMLAASHLPLDQALVLAIPDGGVPVALAVAWRLRLPCDILVVRKLQIPNNPEAGFGALDLDGEMVVSEAMVAGLGLGRETIAAEADRVRRELAARERTFRGQRPFPDLAGRTVILVDDGIASGYTMLAALGFVRRRGAATVVVAAPTASESSLARLAGADVIAVPLVRGPGPFAVASAYREWRDLDVPDAAAMLEAFERDRADRPASEAGRPTT